MELFTPDFGLVFWMFVAFIILFFILAKWGWPIILKNIDSRADKHEQYYFSSEPQLAKFFGQTG